MVDDNVVISDDIISCYRENLVKEMRGFEYVQVDMWRETSTSIRFEVWTYGNPRIWFILDKYGDNVIGIEAQESGYFHEFIRWNNQISTMVEAARQITFAYGLL